MSSKVRPLLIVIVGPTGSGKTALSIRLAQHYNAPIISTDARQIFRGMAIGTAQPTTEELAAATHYFIASHDIHEQYTCGRYEQEALAKLDELFAAGHQTVVAVGGAGLYVKALCEGIDDIPQASDELREQLSERLREKGVEDLFAELEQLDPAYAAEVDRYNPARVQRALEVCLASGRTFSEFRTGTKRARKFDIIQIGTDMDRAELYDRINQRVDQMMADGLEAEARALYPYRNLNSLQTVGYKE
ncbi:MAG: tRNA (adenosine(37)-N6)-dimethylallyltransferase MiaA, partial [Rikenellaceae bacterium]|nr:tRNA (adenosine(37)-N6)-dimethylallyltransferase MiaA [Rikenellaceae bacterium]